MSSDCEEVVQMMLWVCQNLQEVTVKRREGDHISPIVLGKMFYGVQRMSNIHDDENDLILDTLMDCILCVKVGGEELFEEIMSHHLISQIFIGLQNFKIKRESHMEILRYLLKVLEDKSTKISLRNRLGPYQSLAVLLYGRKSIEETGPLIESSVNDYKLKDYVEKVTQKLLGTIFDDSIHHDYRNAKLQRTMQSRSEARVFKIVKDEIYIHNRKVTKSRDVVVGFNGTYTF